MQWCVSFCFITTNLCFKRISLAAVLRAATKWAEVEAERPHGKLWHSSQWEMAGGLDQDVVEVVRCRQILYIYFESRAHMRDWMWGKREREVLAWTTRRMEQQFREFGNTVQGVGLAKRAEVQFWIVLSLRCLLHLQVEMSNGRWKYKFGVQVGDLWENEWNKQGSEYTKRFISQPWAHATFRGYRNATFMQQIFERLIWVGPVPSADDISVSMTQE